MRTSLPALALRVLLGGLLLLPSACLYDNDWVERTGPTGSLTLTPTEPQARLRMHVAIAARKGTGAKMSRLHIGFSAEPRWHLSETDSEAVHPWFRARLVDERDGQVVDESSIIIDEPRPVGQVAVSPNTDLDEDIERFEATYRLELERQGTPSEGTIQVNWRSELSALTDSGDVGDFEVTITQL